MLGLWRVNTHFPSNPAFLAAVAAVAITFSGRPDIFSSAARRQAGGSAVSAGQTTVRKTVRSIGRDEKREKKQIRNRGIAEDSR